MSLRDQIRSSAAVVAKVEVPAWGVTVEVRPMSVRSRSEVFRNAVVDGESVPEKLYPALLIASVFDPESGEKVFTDDDAEWLADQSSAPVELLATKAMELSGLTKAAVEAGKDGS